MVHPERQSLFTHGSAALAPSEGQPISSSIAQSQHLQWHINHKRWLNRFVIERARRRIAIDCPILIHRAAISLMNVAKHVQFWSNAFLYGFQQTVATRPGFGAAQIAPPQWR